MLTDLADLCPISSNLALLSFFHNFREYSQLYDSKIPKKSTLTTALQSGTFAIQKITFPAPDPFLPTFEFLILWFLYIFNTIFHVYFKKPLKGVTLFSALYSVSLKMLVIKKKKNAKSEIIFGSSFKF